MKRIRDKSFIKVINQHFNQIEYKQFMKSYIKDYGQSNTKRLILSLDLLMLILVEKKAQVVNLSFQRLLCYQHCIEHFENILNKFPEIRILISVVMNNPLLHHIIRFTVFCSDYTQYLVCICGMGYLGLLTVFMYSFLSFIFSIFNNLKSKLFIALCHNTE